MHKHRCGINHAPNPKHPKPMILEVALLDVKRQQTTAFETNFAKAAAIISSMDGYIDHKLKRCVERPNRYILLVNWRSLEAHTEGFRTSPDYQRWKALLHHYYDPFPTVEHYQDIALLS
ncbi:MAG: antibiotic biosynthesis monooxygenase [Phormidesmis sp.]